MAINISAWAQIQFGGKVVDVFRDNDIVGMPGDYKYLPGVYSTRYPKIANRSVTNRADGSTLSATSNTENAVTVTADTPLAVHDYVPYSDVNQHGQAVPARYAEVFGRQLAEARQNRVIAYAIKVALGQTGGSLVAGTDVRNDGNGEVTFDDESTDGTKIGVALSQALAQMSADKVPTAGRLCVLHPTYYSYLRQVNWISSVDFAKGAGDNSSVAAAQSFMFHGCKVISLASVFNTDLTSNTDYAAKYRAAFNHNTGSAQNACWGVVISDQALAFLENEKPNGSIDDSPEVDSWLVKARCQFGVGTLQPTGCVAICGDT